MSHLGQYRLSIALFSVGLLCVVSEVFGDGSKPGPLDAATKSIVHRLSSANDEIADQGKGPVELAVSETNSSDHETNSGVTATTAEQQSAPVDVGVIHK